jgi:hypothetical protein
MTDTTVKINLPTGMEKCVNVFDNTMPSQMPAYGFMWVKI